MEKDLKKLISLNKIIFKYKIGSKKIIKEFRISPENVLEIGTKLDV